MLLALKKAKANKQLKKQNKVIENNQFTSFFGKSGHIWKYYRKHINHGFSTNALKSFVPVFNRKAKKLMNKLNESVGGPAFDIFEHMYNFNMETIYRMLKYLLSLKDFTYFFSYSNYYYFGFFEENAINSDVNMIDSPPHGNTVYRIFKR